MSVASAVVKRDPVNLFRWLTVKTVATIVWFEIAVPMFVESLAHSDHLALTTDDAMRLSQVRDLLAGQSWFNLTQWRMNTPYGLPMHWSRVVDAPIAMLMVFFQLFANARTAETIAICLWPLLLLLPAWIAVGRLGSRLAGRECGLIAVLLAAACVPVIGFFRPGEIDHHNAQIVLILWAAVFLTEMTDRPDAAIGAAVMCAISLAIGLETAPYVLVIGLIVAGPWLVRGEKFAPAARRFGITFAVASVILAATLISRREALSTACDTFSGFYVAAAITAGLGLSICTIIPDLRDLVVGRLILLAILGVGLAGLTYSVAPTCLHGPYGGMDPRLWPIFLSGIEEAKSPFDSIVQMPGSFFGSYGFILFGVIASAAAVFLVDRKNRGAAIITLLLAVSALAVYSWEVRGLPFAMMLCVPGLSAALRRIVAMRIPSGRTAATVMIGALLALNQFTFGFVGAHVIDGAKRTEQRGKLEQMAWDCFLPLAVKQLGNLPPGAVMAFQDQGPAVIAFTRDSVVAGPYHRNATGLIDTYDFFTQPPEVGAQILKRRNIDYVMTCNRGGNYEFYMKKSDPGGLVRLLFHDNPPDWLIPIPPPDKKDPSRIYQVAKDRLPAG